MKQVKVEITFQCIELRTITREVDAEELARHNKVGDTAAWLDAMFYRDPMVDCDTVIESIDIHNYDDKAGKEK